MIRTVIIDDENTTEKIISYFVKQGNLPLSIVGSAKNGEEGVALIKSRDPDLVFVDIQMPLKNGFEVMSELPDRRYVIVTAFDTFEYARQALRLGAADIILKPIDLQQLEQSISRASGWAFSGNDTVDAIAHYIHEHYEENISLPRLSREFYLTPSHMARIFKRYTGKSLITYVHSVRIDKARELLAGGCSVKEASEAVGYGSLNNFYKYFKRFTGKTPARFISGPK